MPNPLPTGERNSYKICSEFADLQGTGLYSVQWGEGKSEKAKSYGIIFYSLQASGRRLQGVDLRRIP